MIATASPTRTRPAAKMFLQSHKEGVGFQPVRIVGLEIFVKTIIGQIGKFFADKIALHEAKDRSAF